MFVIGCITLVIAKSGFDIGNNYQADRENGHPLQSSDQKAQQPHRHQNIQ